MQYPTRKHPRLKQYDYRTAAAYFITICAHERMPLFGSIECGDSDEHVRLHLTRYGAIIQEQILNLESHFPFVQISHYVIMPNHLHLLLILDETAMQQPRSLSDVIGRFKSLATRACWQEGYPGKQLFQTSFHEHVIRDETDFESIWNYIDQNPKKWTMDRYYLSD